LVWRTGTRDMNPTVPEHAAEYLAEFRSDVDPFVACEVIEAATIPGRTGLPRVHGVQYVGFIDPSGGSADAFTLAVAHAEERHGVRVAVLDYLAERRSPFSPDAVVAEYADVLSA
jgi:hypothetical protein